MKPFNQVLLKCLGTLIIGSSISACHPFVYFGTWQSKERTSQLEKAELLSKSGKPAEAINAYEQHITYRLSITDRPEWENPYFYHLKIGDIWLLQDNPDEAVKSYEMAETKKVEKELIADRYRAVAEWYEKHNNLKGAYNVLMAHKLMDPLLFETMLDKISRKIVAQEEAHEEK